MLFVVTCGQFWNVGCDILHLCTQWTHSSYCGNTFTQSTHSSSIQTRNEHSFFNVIANIYYFVVGKKEVENDKDDDDDGDIGNKAAL